MASRARSRRRLKSSTSRLTRKGYPGRRRLPGPVRLGPRQLFYDRREVPQLRLVEPADQDRVDPPALPPFAQLRDEIRHGPDQRIGRLEDVAGIGRQSQATLVAAGNVGRALERLG